MKKKNLSRSSHFLEKAAEALASTLLGHAAPEIWGVSWLGTSSSQIRKGFLEPRILGRWGMREVVKEERIRKTNRDMPNLPRTQKAIAAIWTHGRAFQKEPEPLGGEKTGYVFRHVCHVIAQLSGAQWNLSNINSPQARKQTWRHRVWVWKKDVWGVKETGIAFFFSLLGEGWEDELSPRHTSQSLTPTSPSMVWSSSESRILHQTLMKNGLRCITLRLQSSPKAMDHMQVHQRMPACLPHWLKVPTWEDGEHRTSKHSTKAASFALFCF